MLRYFLWLASSTARKFYCHCYTIDLNTLPVHMAAYLTARIIRSCKSRAHVDAADRLITNFKNLYSFHPATLYFHSLLVRDLQIKRFSICTQDSTSDVQK